MPGLVPVEDAIARILAGVVRLPAETVPIGEAAGRLLAERVAARRTQPPFDASAMDGYALRAADAAHAGARLTIVGTSAAGKGFAGRVDAGQAVRIYTGAPVPAGADAVLIQENATVDGTALTATEPVVPGRNIRRAGYDFREGDVGFPAGKVLGIRELALAGAMGYGEISVVRQPHVAIIATGDELVSPGTLPGPDQIVASNTLAIAAYARACGAEVTDLGIVRDDEAAIQHAVAKALAIGAHVIVTIGGVSVGDHDLVRPAVMARGFAFDFWKIAMRPGKPLMFARAPARTAGAVRLLGLPGNPASSIVCTLVFLTPLLDALVGRPPRDRTEPAVLGADLPANDDRQDYMRSKLVEREGGPAVATPLSKQDSGMMSAMVAAECLLIRPPLAPAAKAGDPCRVLRLP
jgi:molybdopterin molybdotransferase